MSDHNIIALCADTREFVPVKSVDSNNRGKYVCSKCNTTVIFRNCTQKVKHFAHLSVSECSGESDLHKFGKKQIKIWLDQGYSIYIKDDKEVVSMLEKEINDEVFIEKGGSGYIADVAMYRNGQPYVIIEITHTHKTTSERPCKWYDINVYDIIGPQLIDYKNKIIVIHGGVGVTHKPKPVCKNWIEKEGEYVEKGKKVPSRGYVCDVPCIECGRITYYPFFSNKRRGYLNLCAYGCREEKCEV